MKKKPFEIGKSDLSDNVERKYLLMAGGSCSCVSDIGSSAPLAPTLYVRTGGVCAIVPRADFRQRNTGVLRLIYMTMTTSVMFRFLDIR